jgi:flagellar hook assembly protein FlgD
MMTSLSPSSFTVTGSHFSSNGTVYIQILNSSGSVVATSSTTADSSGNINVTVPSSQVLSIGPSNTTGTYSGSVMAVDQMTGVSSNAVSITLSVTISKPTISLSATSFSYVS